MDIAKLKKLTILIVDDHPFIIDSFINIINTNDGGHYRFEFITAQNAEDAVKKIRIHKSENKKINVAFLDINIPPFENIKSGADLTLLVKEMYPNCKIVIITAFSEPIKVYNLIQKVNVEVILCKSDVDFNNLSDMCIKVNYQEKYLSETIKKEFSSIAKKKMNLDNLDLDILEKMSQGFKTIELQNYIPLSLSAIEKRKARLKLELIQNKGNDKMLLEQAKNLGLL
jgi:DNA-binding NarL/FixJ family response regulator